MKQLFFFLFFIQIAIAQTGIGTTTPNASAKLEVYATNKGFLPPRIALTATTDASTIASPAAGLLIYNTATAGAAPNNIVPGYYYWNGTAWIQIAGGLVIDATKTASFSLAAADNNKLFFISSASTVTVTVPTLPIGFSCQLIQTGVGTITFAGSGTTLNSASGLSTRATNSVIGLVMNSTTIGYVFGDTIY
ncbi:hypothetical protein [Flavobacterium sp.]|jgi:hypothetical protein|uniref:hypothetical protein n=1 Tax=Flavobacterium sp. TaxID=239 RepID=UPI0025D92F99|nr:hypothetical protein [Flavobacterium sp.]